MNYYEILGVDINATPDEIKAAYRKRAQETHPDTQDFLVHEDPSAEFKIVSEAYHILKDPQTRAEYTKHGMLNPEYKAAIKLLQNSLIGIVSNVNSGYVLDPIIQLRDNTKGYLKRLSDERADTLNTVKLYSSVQIKIKVKSKLSRNIFNEGLDELQERLSDRIKSLDNKIKAGEKMLEILENYEYETIQFFPIHNPVEC